MIAVLIIALILIVMLVTYYTKYIHGSVYVKSNIDSKYYLVRDLPDKQEVADAFAEIRNSINDLIIYMKETAPEEFKPFVENLDVKFNNAIISENIYDSYYTSYSVNKGEQLVFCIRSRKDESNKRHDTNLMMYVVLHEVSHIACPEYGHTDTFKRIFKYITESAIAKGLYIPINFEHTPTEYCGMIITDSIV